MTNHERVLSRRALLGTAVGGLAAGVAGCTTSRHRPAVDPDAAALESARASERALLAAYAPGSVGHTVHLAHLRALGGTPATASPGAPGTVHEAATVQPLREAAIGARGGGTAALLASIAASHAVLGARGGA